MKASFRTFAAAALLSVCVSCSTTRLVPEGEYRYRSSKIEIEGNSHGKDLNVTDLSLYLKQSPNKYFIFGWNPLLNIYNWSDGSGKGLNGFLEKMGEAPVIYNQSLTDASVENVKTHMQYLGYYNSKVEAVVTKSDRMADVKYIVTPGKRYTISELVFDVPEGELGTEFDKDRKNVTVAEGDFISEKSLETESVRSATYLRNLGFYDFSKSNYFFEADTLTGNNILYYRIKGHTRSESADNDSPILRYRIGDVRISHPAEMPFRDPLLRKFNTIQPGALYSETMVNTTYNRFAALKVFNNVSIEMSPRDSALVDCDIRLSGTGTMGFKVNLEGSVNTAGFYGVSPQLSYYHKNLFHGGEWLNVAFTGNLQFKPQSDARAIEYGATASLSLPKLLGFPIAKIHGSNIPRTEMKTSFNYQNRPEYTRNIASFSYGYTGQLGRSVYYQIYPLKFNLAKIFNISDSFNTTLSKNPYLWDSFSDHIDMGVGGMIYHTTDTDIVPKTTYHYVRFSFAMSGNVLSLFNNVLPVDDAHSQHLIFSLPYNQYVKGDLSLGNTFRFGANDGQALAIHFDAAAGYAYGNSYALPFEEQFYVGGASSMRGWQARTLGPGFSKVNSDFIIPSQTANLKFEADLEYRFKAFWKIEGALFAEAGNIWDWDTAPLDMLHSIAGDWGLGLRVNLDFILLRLDMGFKVHDPSRDEGSRWLTPDKWLKSDGFALHFGVGYPF